jgi:hypothetical protein
MSQVTFLGPSKLCVKIFKSPASYEEIIWTMDFHYAPKTASMRPASTIASKIARHNTENSGCTIVHHFLHFLVPETNIILQSILLVDNCLDSSQLKKLVDELQILVYSVEHLGVFETGPGQFGRVRF